MIKSIELSNYKSIFDRTRLEFSTPADGPGLTVLVGENNSGKSTLLRALSEALSQSADFVFDKLDRHDDDPYIEVELAGSGEGISLRTEKYSSSNYRKVYVGPSEGQRRTFNEIIRDQVFPDAQGRLISFVPSRRPWTDDFNSQSATGGDFGQYEVGEFQITLNSNNPRTIQLPNLGDYLNKILRNDDKEKFNELLKFVLPDLSNWSTDRFAGADKIVSRAEDGREHAIGKSGDGVLSVFRICYSIFVHSPEVPLVIDEPELSLHPQAQKKMYELLRDVAAERQIIIATHSPHFVDWRDLNRGASLFRFEKQSNGATSVSGLSRESIARINAVTDADPRNRRLFDYLAKEVVFQRAAVFVEGPEDVHMISGYIEDNCMNELPLFSYGVGGAEKIERWLRFCSDLGIAAIGIYDQNKADIATQTAESYVGNAKVKVMVLPRDDIRDKFDPTKPLDGEERKMICEGFFDEKWNFKPECKNEFDAFLAEVQEFVEKAGR